MKYRMLFMIVFYAFAKVYTQDIPPQNAIVDFTKIDASLNLDFEGERISGHVNVYFTMLKDAEEVYLDAVVMKGSGSSEGISTRFEEKKIVFEGSFESGKSYDISFNYSAQPKQAAYFVNNKGNYQFWTQGQGKYTSYWLPSLDDMNDKIEFDITVTGHTNETVIANGVPEIIEKDYNVKVSKFDMENPISSYLVALVAGNYNRKMEISQSGIPLSYYYYPEDSLKVEPTYRYSKQIFDFFENEIGVSYPFRTYKQVPVKDFLYAGMENASCTVFADNFVVDSIGFVDRNYVNVNAHELAHQWFGDLVTETKSDHHWLHEGFATYYALLAEKEIFGEDYFYFKLFETAEQLRDESDAGNGQTLVAVGGSSLTYYQKGAWAIHILREKVGEIVFTNAVQSYLQKYAYANVTTDDFMSEVETVTAIDLTDFKKNWLYQSAFQAQDALESLKKSTFMQEYFQLQGARLLPLESKYKLLLSAVNSGNEYLGQEAVYQLSDEPIKTGLPIYKQVINSNTVFIRQAIATSVQKIPQELVLDFYDLLSDDSYLTREQAFIKLWFYYQSKEDDRAQRALLDTMDSQFGFANGNIRTLWLALSLATADYKPQESSERYQELISYSAPEQPYQLRVNAFQYLRQLDSFEEKSFRHLVEASVHHVWRFRESARKMLKEQVSNPQNLALIRGMEASFSKQEKVYLQKEDIL